MLVDKCADRLWVGSRAAVDDEVSMLTAGITAIVNVADDADTPPWGRNHCKCLYVPLKEHWKMTGTGLIRGNDRNPPEVIDAAVKAIKDFLGAGETVLCHCQAGCHRSPGIVALYMIRHLGMGPHDAYGRIQAIRPGVRRYDENEFLPQ